MVQSQGVLASRADLPSSSAAPLWLLSLLHASQPLERTKGKEELTHFFYFFKIYLFIYLFLAALGLRCCVRAFSSCGEQGLLFIAVRRLLIVVASLAAEHRL